MPSGVCFANWVSCYATPTRQKRTHGRGRICLVSLFLQDPDAVLLMIDILTSSCSIFFSVTRPLPDRVRRTCCDQTLSAAVPRRCTQVCHNSCCLFHTRLVTFTATKKAKTKNKQTNGTTLADSSILVNTPPALRCNRLGLGGGGWRVGGYRLSSCDWHRPAQPEGVFSRLLRAPRRM